MKYFGLFLFLYRSILHSFFFARFYNGDPIGQICMRAKRRVLAQLIDNFDDLFFFTCLGRVGVWSPLRRGFNVCALGWSKKIHIIVCIYLILMQALDFLKFII